MNVLYQFADLILVLLLPLFFFQHSSLLLLCFFLSEARQTLDHTSLSPSALSCVIPSLPSSLPPSSSLFPSNKTLEIFYIYFILIQAPIKDSHNSLELSIIVLLLVFLRGFDDWFIYFSIRLLSHSICLHFCFCRRHREVMRKAGWEGTQERADGEIKVLSSSCLASSEEKHERRRGRLSEKEGKERKE